MNRSHRWTPPWSSGSSHTCREHGIEPTVGGLRFSLLCQQSTDNLRCVGVSSVAHKAAVSAVACQLHVVRCMTREWRGTLHSLVWQVCVGYHGLCCSGNPFPQKARTLCRWNATWHRGAALALCLLTGLRRAQAFRDCAAGLQHNIGVRVWRVSTKALHGICLVGMHCALHTCSIHCMVHRKLRYVARRTTSTSQDLCAMRGRSASYASVLHEIWLLHLSIP